MIDINKVIMIGRISRDPDIRYSQGEKSTCFANYSIAVDRRFKREGEPDADFFNCVAIGKNGEFVEKYLHKGMKIAITGHLQTRSYTNKDGQKVNTVEIIVEEHEFCESRNSQQNGQNAPAQRQQQNGYGQQAPRQAQRQPQPQQYAQQSQGYQPQQSAIDDFMSIPDAIDEDDLPFR